MERRVRAFAPVPISGWSLTVLASGLHAPDGVAMDREGTVYVAEESAGTIFVRTQSGLIDRWRHGLRNPEGLTVGDEGEIYAVEDVADGRLVEIRRDEHGVPVLKVLANGLKFPEGVTFGDDDVYYTESNVEEASSPFQYRTWIGKWSRATGKAERIHSASLTYSYSGMTFFQGVLYFLNEASGTGTRDSVFSLSPDGRRREILARGIPNPEGISWDRDRSELYVASESRKRGEHGTGAVYRVFGPRLEQQEVVASGFGSVEDVHWIGARRLLVSDDSSGILYLLERRE